MSSTWILEIWQRPLGAWRLAHHRLGIEQVSRVRACRTETIRDLKNAETESRFIRTVMIGEVLTWESRQVAFYRARLARRVESEKRANRPPLPACDIHS